MNTVIDISKRTVGVNFNSQQEAEIKVWAPLAKEVSLILEHDNSKILLHKQAYGYWGIKTNRLQPGNFYRFNIGHGRDLPDPASLSQLGGVHGASEAIDVNAFQWTDKCWNNPPLDSYIIYELHTGTFTSGGTFASLEEKLDHLTELGVNAIEIMPVAQFPGERNWGYDGVFPFAVQSSYGGAKGLQQLVNACHQKGIAVILDVVYNHLGPEGNYLQEFGPYFTAKYNTPWGNAVNFDDARCDAVRNYFIENALMWFRDFHIDALRLDAVHAIKDFSPKHILQEIKEQVLLLAQKTGKKYYLIAELDLNDTRFVKPIEKGGFGMDAQWIDEFHHALYVASGGEKQGYYTDFEGVEHLAKAFNDAYVYDGIYSEHRLKTFGMKADEIAGGQFVVFSQNHDQVGNRMLGERSSELFSFEMQKLRAAAVLLSPFLPMLFMGEEWAETNPFQYFVSHTDTELAEAVRKGRKAEFEAFHTVGEAPDPMAEETFERSKLQWHLLNEKPHQTMFAYYRYLIALRKSNSVLQSLNRKNLKVLADQQKHSLVMNRWEGQQKLFAVLNFSREEAKYQLPNTEQWSLLLNSASAEWGGSWPAEQAVEEGDTISVAPESVAVYVNVNN